MSDYSENDKICDVGCEGGEKQGLLKDASVILAAAFIILGGLHAVRGILGPIFLAAFFAAMLTSPMRWLRSKGWSQTSSLTTVILFVLLIGGGTITVVGSQLKQFAGDVPEYRNRFNDELAKYNLELGDFIPFLKEEKKDEGKQKEGNEVEAEESAESLAIQRRVRVEVDRFMLEHSRQERQNGEAEKNAPTLEKLTSNLKPKVSPITQVAYQTPELDVLDEASLYGEPSPTAVETEENGGLRASSAELEGGEEESVGVAESGDASTENANNRDEIDDLATLDADGVLEDETLETAARNEEGFAPPISVLAPPTNGVQAASNELFSYLARLASELSYFASNSFIVTLLVIFMLCETTSMPKKMAAALGKRSFVNEHIQKVVADIRNYMVIKTWMSLGVGCCVTLLLIVSDVQYPLLWGFVAFLLNYIPNIGSVVAAFPPIILATVEHGLVVGAVDAVFFVLINCTIGYALEPRLLGNGLDLSPLIVLIALILFGWLLGPIGMFLSPPLAVIMKIVFQSFPETRWIAVLMANRPPKDDVDLEGGQKLGAKA